uniref:Orange domain-containing protein n=1 Tax=Sinocyclocheilus anshuiensis TaxID=1608454 RepID=A0A671RP03_9TELE
LKGASPSQQQGTFTSYLQKPMVEKMCRDRINSSIEQLKCLLSPEFLKQQPDSKLEEADILEMISHAVNQGFSRCVGEIVHFLSKDEMKTQSRVCLLKHFQKLGVKLSSWRARARQSFVPTHIPCSFQISLKDLISWCLITVESKLCRAPALQELSLTPLPYTLDSSLTQWFLAYHRSAYCHDSSLKGASMFHSKGIKVYET